MKLLKYIVCLVSIQTWLHADASDDALADYGSLEEPTSVVVAAPPPPPAGETPLQLELPVFGTLNLYPYVDPQTKQAGFRVPMPDTNMRLVLGPLVIANGAFTMINDKLSYGADATLFGVGVRVSLKDMSPAESEPKETAAAPAKPAKTTAKNETKTPEPSATKESHSKITWGIDTLPGQYPTLELIPGAPFVVHSADITFEKAKASKSTTKSTSAKKDSGTTTLVLHTTLAGKPVDFAVTVGSKGSDVAASVPSLPLIQLIPEAQGTPVEGAQLTEVSLTVKNFTSREKPPKKQVITFTATADFSGVPGISGPDAHAMTLTGSYDSDKKVFTLDAASNDVDLPGVGTIHNAKIEVVLSKAKKSVILQGKMDVDAGFGAITIDVNAEVTKKGIEFSAALGNEISSGGVTVKNPKISFSTITKQASISGEAEVLGRTTSVTLTRDKNGKFAVATSLGGTVKPFAIFHVPLISDLEIQDVQASMQQQKKGSALAFTGKVTFLGQTTNIAWATTADGKFAAEIDVPGTLDIIQLTKSLGPIGTMFSEIGKVLTVQLSDAKFIAANGTVAILPDVTIPAPGFDVAGTVSVGGYLGSFLNKIGLRGGVQGDVFLPLTPGDINKVRVSISKSVDASLIGDFVKVNAFALNVQGSQPFPNIGLSLQANIAGADVNLEGAVQPEILKIDLKGSVKGDINLDALGHKLGIPFPIPIDIDHPLFVLHLLEDAPTGIGIAGKFKLGSSTADIYTDIDVLQPQNSVLQFSNVNICMTDMYNLWMDMARNALGAAGGPKLGLSLPKLLCLKNAKGSWALKPTTKENCTQNCMIIPGFLLEGDVDLGVPGIPAGYGHFEFSPSQITMQGSLKGTINLGGVIKISDASGNKPPTLGMKVSKDEQRVWIDGVVDIAGLLKQQTQAQLDTSGITVNTKESYLGVDSTLIGQFPFAHPLDGTLAYELNDEKLVNFILHDLGNYLGTAKNEVNKYMNDANDAISSAEGKCGDIVVISDICKAPLELAKGAITGLKESVKGALTGIDQITEQVTKTFHLDYVSVKGSMAAFKGQSPVTVTVKFSVLGKNVGPISISVPNPKDIGSLSEQAAKIIYNKAIDPAVNGLVDGVKNAYGKVIGFVNEAISKIAGIAGEIGKVAVQGYEAVKGAGETAGKAIKGAGETAGKAIKGTAEQAGGAIKGAGETTGKAIASGATTAGKAIEGTAEKAGGAIKGAAESTGNAVKNAGEKVGNAFKSAGESVAHAFNPSNW